MKITFQADANLRPAIWQGLRRREPSIDFEGHMGVIPDATSDLDVLRIAAAAGRVLVSPDIRTMPEHFQTFLASSDSPGLILIPSRRSISQIIDGLLLIWLDWSPERLHNQAVWLPTTSEGGRRG